MGPEHHYHLSSNIVNDMHDGTIATGDKYIPTIFIGADVKAGVYNRRVDHYDILRTLVDMYGLASIGKSAFAQALTDIWQAHVKVKNDGFI